MSLVIRTKNVKMSTKVVTRMLFMITNIIEIIQPSYPISNRCHFIVQNIYLQVSAYKKNRVNMNLTMQHSFKKLEIFIIYVLWEWLPSRRDFVVTKTCVNFHVLRTIRIYLTKKLDMLL